VETIEERALLPAGGEALVRVGIFEDPYIGDDTETVGIEVVVDGETTAALNTVLDADQDAEARELVQEIIRGLESGELEPTAAAIEPLADEPR
jgi:hypothetical protein